LLTSINFPSDSSTKTKGVGALGTASFENAGNRWTFWKSRQFPRLVKEQLSLAAKRGERYLRSLSTLSESPV